MYRDFVVGTIGESKPTFLAPLSSFAHCCFRSTKVSWICQNDRQVLPHATKFFHLKFIKVVLHDEGQPSQSNQFIQHFDLSFLVNANLGNDTVYQVLTQYGVILDEPRCSAIGFHIFHSGIVHLIKLFSVKGTNKSISRFFTFRLRSFVGRKATTDSSSGSILFEDFIFQHTIPILIFVHYVVYIPWNSEASHLQELRHFPFDLVLQPLDGLFAVVSFGRNDQVS
mmetsp:Transcript_21060/g.34849  ORF Transcript_21060/g.34849 Transcript_21060/m.34849 type:complete len:225 (+) Transcript_21060:1412-2086(+)